MERSHAVEVGLRRECLFFVAGAAAAASQTSFSRQKRNFVVALMFLAHGVKAEWGRLSLFAN